MTSQYKLIATDLDGTLLNSDKQISDENQRWIAQAREAGIEPTIATGRHQLSVLDTYAKQLQIQVPIVTLNGGLILAPDGAVLMKNPLSQDEILYLHQLATEYNISWLAFTANGIIDRDGLLRERAKSDDVWLKYVFRCEDVHVLKQIHTRLREYRVFELSSADKLNIEINPVGIHKAFGLEYVCQRLHIDRRQVIAIGDGLNDVAMLKWAGLGIAMGNATDEVKAAADMVTESCDDDGVGRAIQKVLQMSGTR
jgi:5-amino-6-(5-phospho-D-ribitylamino)uracil phosphatase